MRLLASRAALVLTLVLAAPAWAAPAAPTWVVDKAASKIGFSGAMSGQPFYGALRRWDATIRFDPKALATSSINVQIDTRSAATGDPSRDEALPSADWFSAAAFPRATFAANQFKDLGAGRYQAIGSLTLRGVTRPVTLPFTLDVQGEVATMQGALTLDRRAFGVGQGQFASGDTVAAAVRVNVSIRAKRGAARP